MAAAEKGKGELFKKGREAYGQTCIACHAPDGKGMPAPEHNGTTLAPALAGSRKLLADKQLVARIVLHGLTGPNNGVNYPGQMASFKWATDEWLASILTYARNDWGNKGSAITPEDIAGMRQVEADRNRPYTLQELYQQTQATAPVTPTGAKPSTAPGEIVVDASTVELHGKGIHVDCYPSGLDIGYWNDAADWVSWSVPQVPAGDYKVIVRTTNPSTSHKPHDFTLHVASTNLAGSAPFTATWDEYCDTSIGSVHVDQAGPIALEFRPKADGWGPTNLSAVKLVPAAK